MIRVISYKDIPQHSELLFSHFQLRHREFIHRQNYAVRSLDGMEFDQYDTLASNYLVYSEDGRTVQGCSRLTPIKFGCMLEDQFPDLVDDKTIFARSDIWEGTRFCIDSRLPPDKRRDISRHIAAAYIEFGLHQGAKAIIGLMPTLILRSVFERTGIRLERLGSAQMVGEHSRIQAAAIPIKMEQLERVRAVTGLGEVIPFPRDARDLQVA